MLTDKERKANKAASSKAWALANKEKIAASNKAWALANKEKISAKMKAWYIANKKKCNTKTKAYYLANKEKEAIRKKAYALANKEKIAAKSKVWRLANKEKIATKKKVWNLVNKEKLAIYVAERRALRLNAESIMTEAEKENYANLVKIRDDANKLYGYVYGVDDEYWSIDHIIPLTKGGTNAIDNLEVVPLSWNKVKKNTSSESFWG